MKPSVRRALTSDAHDVVELIRAYAGEVFEREATVSTEALLNDGFGSVLEFFVAESNTGSLLGFAAWEKTYDVISGRRGGALLGMFVQLDARGRGTGQALLNAVANEVRAMGGEFLVGLGTTHPEFSHAPPALGFHGDIANGPRRQTAADLSPAELNRLGNSLHPGGRRT
jgi:GNAT superfamily N-acetyltransferase